MLLLFIYLSRRVGDWIALAAVLPILFMGTAYEDLLTAFQINYFGSVAFGIGALLAIERRDRRGDLIACVLLLASLAFAEIALAFAAGVLVAIVLQRGPLRRCWVIAVPAVLYALWYAIYEAGESSYLSVHNVALSPAYVVDGFASSLGSLFGHGTPILFHGEGGLPWGRPLLVAAIVGATFWLLRPRTTVRASILIPLAVGLVFWLLTAANYQPGRPPTASRYQYVGAVFVLLIAGELAAGWRPRWRAVLAAFAVSVAAAAANLVTLHDGYRSLGRFLGNRPRRARRARDRRGPRQPRPRPHEAELQLQLLHVGQSRPLPLRFGEVRLARLYESELASASGAGQGSC